MEHSTDPSVRCQSAKENMAPPPPSNLFDNQPDSRHECPICLNWLEDPIVTSCGHRFCKKCIDAWLQQKTYCPIDNTTLSLETDVFPDNFTRREILQKRLICPFARNGCDAQLVPLEVDVHISSCKFRRTESHEPSVSVNIPCNFKDVGCDFVLKDERQLTAHMDAFLLNHMHLLVSAYSTLKIERDIANLSMTDSEAMCLWDPEKSTGEASSANKDTKESYHIKSLIRSLFERVIVLEQRNREQDITIGNLSCLTNTLVQSQTRLVEDLALKHCMGNYIWKVDNFSQKLAAMFADPKKMFYSRGFYTSPDGYRFCARLNSSYKEKNYMALHVHLMQSDNDDFLEWPFSGKISITLLNQADPSRSLKDAMSARPELKAFRRPELTIGSKSFGFSEYISEEEIKSKGFIVTDTIMIKLKIFDANF